MLSLCLDLLHLSYGLTGAWVLTAMDWSEQGQYPLAASSLQTISPPPSSTLHLHLHPHNSPVSSVLWYNKYLLALHLLPVFSHQSMTMLTLLGQNSLNRHVKVFLAIFLRTKLRRTDRECSIEFSSARYLIAALNWRISAMKGRKVQFFMFHPQTLSLIYCFQVSRCSEIQCRINPKLDF